MSQSENLGIFDTKLSIYNLDYKSTVSFKFTKDGLIVAKVTKILKF